MGAVPKNKITSVERGKRRAGNRKNLKKDPRNSRVQPYKQGLVAQMFSRMGLDFEHLLKK
ncbi:MAG: hypothetical protein U9O78_00160 [Patescibacteria group bacterium]|nr:hypothetical protein [Patescibacteria group bacterium]